MDGWRCIREVTHARTSIRTRLFYVFLANGTYGGEAALLPLGLTAGKCPLGMRNCYYWLKDENRYFYCLIDLLMQCSFNVFYSFLLFYRRKKENCISPKFS